MITIGPFITKTSEQENEKASNSYLMSLIALIAGLPFPIINLMATFFFWVANRKATYFVRWHSTQALLSQFSLVFINSAAFWWTVSIAFYGEQISNLYLSYLMCAIIYNLLEFIATIYTAIQTRKGLHIQWWFYSDLTNTFCKA